MAVSVEKDNVRLARSPCLSEAPKRSGILALVLLLQILLEQRIGIDCRLCGGRQSALGTFSRRPEASEWFEDHCLGSSRLQSCSNKESVSVVACALGTFSQCPEPPSDSRIIALVFSAWNPARTKNWWRLSLVRRKKKVRLAHPLCVLGDRSTRISLRRFFCVISCPNNELVDCPTSTCSAFKMHGWQWETFWWWVSDVGLCFMTHWYQDVSAVSMLVYRQVAQCKERWDGGEHAKLPHLGGRIHQDGLHPCCQHELFFREEDALESRLAPRGRSPSSNALGRPRTLALSVED